MDEQTRLEITFAAWGEPHRDQDGYVGAYHAPGMDIGHVFRPDQRLAVFPTAELAELAAKDRLFQLLNGARENAQRIYRHGKPERYARLTGAQFAELLRSVNITPTFFAEIYGTQVKRVFWWIDGVNDKGHEELVPHPAYLLLRRMQDDPSIIDKIEEDTRRMTTERRPRQPQEDK